MRSHDAAIREAIGLRAEVDHDLGAREPAGPLNRVVGCQEFMGSHLVIAKLANQGANGLIALDEVRFVFFPAGGIKEKQRGGRVESVEQVALRPDFRGLVGGIAPVPLGDDALMIDQLPTMEFGKNARPET